MRTSPETRVTQEAGEAGPVVLPESLRATSVLDHRQRQVLIWSLIALAAAMVLAPLGTLVVLVTLATVVYIATITQRVMITYLSRTRRATVHVTDEEAMAVADEDLPVYTVLVPAYHEAAVIPRLVEHLRGLIYPPERLEVKLLLEQDDDETIAAARAADLGGIVEVVLIPPGGPRTKPNALNLGLLACRGELVTIYDAEDRPDPLQLRRAAVAFAALACRGRLPPGRAHLPQRRPEPHHPLVHDRVR